MIEQGVQVMTIKKFMELINYEIREGGQYGWNCFGNNAFCFDTWDDHGDEYSIGMVFDTRTNIVYQAYACDHVRNYAIRWTHPDYKEAYDNERIKRNVSDNAWDDVAYTEFTDVEKFLIDADVIRHTE